METGGRAGLQQAAVAGVEGGGWVLVQALLQGGAPWGFTLQGGLEHREPLIISKVEEGGKAASLEQPLRVGDEIIIINDVELTGYRQEAISLVKGSYKTLQLTVRRELDPGYIEEFVTSPPSRPALSSPSPTSPLTQPPTPSTHLNRPRSAVQLRIKNRRSEPASRPHSWHSTKHGDGPQDSDQGAMDTMSNAWHHSYHASASTTDLSGGFDSGGGYLRKSPDQYSSRGSMDSLDPPQSSQLHSGAHHQHPLVHHGHSGSHPTYSSCHQLSSARSSNSIDHLHSKRDSAYSSVSTSSSIPEYLASTPSFSPERSYSLEMVSQRGGGSGEMQQADMRYVRTVYDAQQGLSQEHELSSTSAALLRKSDSRGGSRTGQSRDGSVGGVCYRGSSSSSSSGSSGTGIPASNRHSVGPIWAPSASRSSYENLKGAPAPPRRSDSYAAIKNHERPNSWSSLENARSLRSLHKGSWHHSSGTLASGTAKGSYGAEGQLHTVIEKSPESSPTTKPRQGGSCPQPLSATGPSSEPAGPHTQPSRLILLPTGVYPVPQPEPHYAQIPSSSPDPSLSGVYPALAKESSRQQQQKQQAVGGRDEGSMEVRRDGRSTENGYQNNTSSQYHHSSSVSAQLRTHEADRRQQEEFFRPHIKTEGGSEGQARIQRHQNHQGPYSQSSQGPQEQNFHVPQIHSPGVRPPSLQEKSSHYTHKSWGDRSRSMDQTSIHSEPVTSSWLPQGQVLPSHSQVHPQPQAPPSSTSQPSRHFSDSAALQYQHWDHREQDKDKEHPLTRLENALAEVQRCTSPESSVSAGSHGSKSFSDSNQGPARSLSVLEKVSRFERRERAGKQRSHSTNNSHNKATHLRMTEKGLSSPCGAEDLRNMLERSTKGTKAHRTLSYRGGSGEHVTYRTPADPSSALQRSRSSFQLDGSRESINSKDFPWRQEIQEIMGPMQDISTSRSYRESLKDAQSKVLRSTSLRRQGVSSVSPPPSAAPTVSSSSHQPPPVPAKYHSSMKKGPKTMPKPQGIVITSQSVPAVTSPHTPKERHVVSPDVRGPSPPALPSIPPVGPPPLMRICGRKRLTADQKIRSYSEPENMNEVGVLDNEAAPIFWHGGETSVADRRKMFELVASAGGGASQNATSRSDLRQVQQDALAEYVERKRSVKRAEAGQRGGSRPRSAYVQPENNQTASYCYSDTLSLSSTSSLLSLQDSGPDRNLSSGENRLCSTLPPGADLRSLQSNMFYPGRVTTPRPPAHPPPSSPPGSTVDLWAQVHQDLKPEVETSRQRQPCSRGPSLDLEHHTTELKLTLGVSKQLNGALQRAGSNRSSGKSASAEDLLERAEDRERSPQHYRSRSSPSSKRLSQDFLPGDVRMFGVFISEPGHCALAADRPSDIHIPGEPVPTQPSQNTFQSAAPSPSQGSSHTPVTRRDRQRNSDRQRAQSTSTLAASVGLPCPFSPPQDRGTAEWQASERLSQANLDAIVFPGIPQSGGCASDNEGTQRDRQTRHSLGDASILEKNAKDEVHRGRAFSLETRGGHSAEHTKPPSLTHFQLAASPNRKGSRSTTPPPLPPHPSIHQHLSSLRISESSLFSPTEQRPPLETSMGASQEDYDEVFLQSPAPPPPPPLSPPPVKDIMEDFPPPPPPPLELEQEAEQEAVLSPSSDFFKNSNFPTRKSSLQTSTEITSSPVSPPPAPPPIRTVLNKSSSVFSIAIEDNLSLEYQPLPKREKTSEELRVEALAQQLVSQDPSLAPLLDTWEGKCTIQLMGEIFPCSNKLTDKSQWQCSGSARLDERVQDGNPDQSKETDLDEEEKDPTAKKVELCEALRSSVDALQQEKKALSEEQRRHQALGASIEILVQECLKTNEKDKYSMFIGDLERIVNLLLSLCSRLSRIDRSLHALKGDETEDAAEERDSLHHKRSLLLRQTEDAQELKENLDRRQRVVHIILSGYLTETQLQDYRHFVSAKPSLLIRQRHLDELIRQKEEQLTRLAESLPSEVAEAHGWSTAFSSHVPCSSPFPSLLPPSVIPGPAFPVRSTTVTSL
ncbi:protein Shroom3 isoform X2 [Parambassis ranga]|uniref:Protein Shroom3 isoform X2 n=1 Tax=Parambassis ranga TaxID=210632 RepID=A0A6P7J9K9_9TELE|nr:protein Shroom3 isoform X2 [Parambassis ranga]